MPKLAPIEVLDSHAQRLVGAVVFDVVGVLQFGRRGWAYVGTGPLPREQRNRRLSKSCCNPRLQVARRQNAKILRRGRPLWTLPRLDGSAVPMSHLTPIVGSTVWPGGHARENKSRQEFTG